VESVYHSAIKLVCDPPVNSNRNLEVGRIYTMTAAPATGLIFSNWAGNYTLNFKED